MLDKAFNLIKSSSNVVVLTGAGISTNSGIPDFRSKGSGLWEKFDPMVCLSKPILDEDPKKFYKYFPEMTNAIAEAQPNEAHIILAELQKKGIIKTIITQNIDGLHQKAGSTNVLEVHGNLRDCYCEGCGKRFDLKFLYDKIEQGDFHPLCECGDWLRPDVVLFGDTVIKYNDAQDIVMSADVLISIGTSLSVYPVNNLPRFVDKNMLINRDDTEMDDIMDIIIKDDISKAVFKLGDMLLRSL